MNHEQQDIFRAMLDHDGDRPKVCKALGISMSTLYRYFNQYHMHPIIERCGWKRHAAAVPGKRATNAVVKSLIQKAIKAGAHDIHQITVGVYGQDAPELRERVFTVMNSMGINDISLDPTVKLEHTEA